MRRTGSRLVAAVAPALLLFGAACGGTNNSGSTETNTAKSASTSVSAVSATLGSPAPAGGLLTEVTTDNKFSQTTYTVTAGEAVTFTLQNKGSAIHNWHVLDVQDASGKDVKTDLADAGKAATTTFTIAKSGIYPFRCDLHPDDMKGTVTVS